MWTPDHLEPLDCVGSTGLRSLNAVRRRIIQSIHTATGLTVALSIACTSSSLNHRVEPLPVPDGACVVIGFLGGMDAWDDATKGVRRLALDLRDSARGVHTQTFENRRLRLALTHVEEILDTNANGAIDPGEAHRIRVVVYGQSLGGWAAVEFARVLAARGVPVAFLLQIDSVGLRDAEIPPNVREAANFYQNEGRLIAGEVPVRAADTTRTRVLGNWEFDYDRPPGSEIDIGDLPWWKKAFRVAHARMDRDPRVWAAAKSLIEAACHEGE